MLPVSLEYPNSIWSPHYPAHAACIIGVPQFYPISPLPSPCCLYHWSTLILSDLPTTQPMLPVSLEYPNSIWSSHYPAHAACIIGVPYFSLIFPLPSPCCLYHWNTLILSDLPTIQPMLPVSLEYPNSIWSPHYPAHAACIIGVP